MISQCAGVLFSTILEEALQYSSFVCVKFYSNHSSRSHNYCVIVDVYLPLLISYTSTYHGSGSSKLAVRPG